MANPYANRKKIRGWKRKVRQLRIWTEAYQRIHPHRFWLYSRDYAKLIIDPFYRIHIRRPPNWYLREVADALDTVYDAWREDIKRCGYPADLQLWLFEQQPIRSQVVAIRSESGMAQPPFLAVPEPRAFPSFFSGNKFSPTAYDWTLTAEGLELDPPILLGYVWVGRKKSDPDR